MLVQTVTTTEAEWDDEERAKVLALLEYESQGCPGCGGYLPETTDPDIKWVAELPSRCHRCDTMLQKQAEYKDQRRPEALSVWPVRQI